MPNPLESSFEHQNQKSWRDTPGLAATHREAEVEAHPEEAVVEAQPHPREAEAADRPEEALTVSFPKFDHAD